MGNQLLDLEKAADRDHITLPGGTSREVINSTDLGLWEFGRLNALQAEAATIDGEISKAKGRVSPPRQKRRMQVLGETVKLLIPEITPRELSQLSRANREQIILVWWGRNAAAAQDGENKADPPRRPRTGGGSARASKSSTAATRKGGTTSRSGR